MNILETIVENKRLELKKKKSAIGTNELEKRKLFASKTYSLKNAIKDENSTGIIAEFKRRSPSKGIINGDADVVKITAAYTRNGAAGLSILTDENFFGGSDDDLVRARINSVPILRKDFMIDEYQVIESKSIGADVILLIAACLTTKEVQQLARFAKSFKLEVLLEIHNEKELDHICEEIDLVGVNNRDLKTFKVDIDRSVELSDKIPAGKMKISESGISDIGVIHHLRTFGYKGFLIGENFMKENDPAIAFANFINKLKSGIT
jgi:indole-3-glycerol phosphate synthase